MLCPKETESRKDEVELFTIQNYLAVNVSSFHFVLF